MEKLRQAIFNDSETRIYPIVKSAVVRKAAATQVKKFIRAQIKDQDLQEKLMPDYEIGCKRMLVSDDFLPALNRKNVTVETRGVARFTADGVVTGDGRTLPFDAVVFATGFDLESHKRGIDVTGQGGVNLKALWQDQSDAYRASMVPGFPNYFLVTGPNAGVGTSSVVYLIEQSVNWIIEVIKTAGRSKLISVCKDACRQFSDNVQQQLGETVWATGCDSWYISPNGRNETLFPGNAQDFAEQMSHVDTDDFIVTDIAGQNDLHPTEWAPLHPQSDKRSIEMRELDPTLQAILFSEEARNAPDMTQMSPDGARAYYKAMVAKLESTISIPSETEDGVMDLTDRSLSYRIYRPDTDATKAPALVFFHGGGMMVGDLDTHDNPCRAIVKRSGVCIISVEYRLAPEHRFPTAAEDGYDAFCWVVENADTLGIDPGHVAIGGDSAGGNVSAAVTLMLRDRGGPACAAQLLIYPAVGPEKDTGSLVELASGYGLDRDLIDWFNGNYAPSLVDRADIRVSPLRAKTHANLPPAIVITAGFDPLRDEGLAYAEQLKACGVSVQYREYPDLIHGFLSWVGVIPSAQDALNEIADLLASAFPVTASANI
jgi:acetyl esterase/lipase